MDKKTTAIVGYITIIGWLIAFFSYKNQEKNSFVSFHLKQSFGLFIAWLIIYVVFIILLSILVRISLALAGLVSIIYSLLWLAYLIFLIIGILNANKEEEIPLPIIGKYFIGKFNFIP